MVVADGPVGIDWVPDEDLGRLLAVPIDPTVALLHDVRIVGNFEMDHQATVVLEVDAFGGRIRRKQDADRRGLRIGLEGRLDGLTFVIVHAAIDEVQPVPAVAVGDENALQPVLCRAVFGEEDDTFVGPRPVLLQVSFEPVENGLGFRVRAMLGTLRPATKFGEFRHLALGRRPHPAACFVDSLHFRVLAERVVVVILFGLRDGPAQDAIVEPRLLLVVPTSPFERRHVPLDRRSERRRRRREPFLQKLVDEGAGLARAAIVLHALLYVVIEKTPHTALLFG